MSNKKINILFLVHSFNIGGVQIINRQLIENLSRSTFDINVLYLHDGELIQGLKNINKIEKLGNKISLKSPENLKYLKKIIRFIKSNEIDLVHSIDPISYFLGAISSRLTNVKHVRIQPNSLENEMMNFKTFKYTPFQKWTNKYIVLNQNSMRSLLIRGVQPQKVSLIYGFTKISDYNEVELLKVRDELNIKDNVDVIVTIHRLVENKGLKIFIEMIPYILKVNKNMKFLIVGDGPLRFELEEKVKELGIKNYVIFTGFRNDTLEISRMSTLGVYPEGKSAGMINVLRAGKIVITKKDSIMNEYISDALGSILASGRNPVEYADIVINLLENKEDLKRCEEEQVNYMLNKLDGEKNISSYELILKDIVGY